MKYLLPYQTWLKRVNFIFRFLDKAAIKERSNIGSSRTPLTVTQVEGFKLACLWHGPNMACHTDS